MSNNSVASQEQAALDKQVKNLVSNSPQASSLKQTQASVSDPQAASSDNGQQQADSSAPRRPRPVVHRAKNAQLLRRGQFVAFSSSPQQAAQAQHGGSIVIEPQTSYGVPITAQIELANALQPAGRATAMPPKRPSYLPSRPDHHSHHRFAPQQLTTSLGATALTSSSSGKPNRYSWAQMQQWHAAQNAAQMGATGDLFGTQHKHGGSIERGSLVQTETRGGFHYHFSSPFSSAASRVLVVPNPIMNLGEHTKSRLIKIIEALKRFSEKWFSHVLLLLFLASYACLGAYVFISFEASTEQWEKQLIIDTRLRIVNESYDQARELGSREQYAELFRTKFEEYERLLNRMCASGMSSSSLENQWTFWGALFYSMTVFTTIGYGHLTPITFAGRVATMIYAIFGIPILLMVLADLGKLLTRLIKYAFKKFRYWYNKLLGRKATVRTRQLISDHSNQYIGVAKNAFERGFATYIQPYQSRTASALRDAQLRMANLRRSNRAAGVVQLDEAGNTILLVDQDGLPVGQPGGSQMESSEVIVTPPKQTKPVSPKVNENASKAHPLAGQSQAKSTDLVESSHQQNNQRQHQMASKSSGGHEKRAQSPFNQSRRKISATSKHHRKNSVSRSSSASNVATAAERQSKAAAIKRSSLDQATNQANLLQSTVASDSNLQQSTVDLNGEHAQQQQQRQRQLQQDSSQMGNHQDEIGGEEIVDEYDEMDEDLDIPVTFALFLLITYMMFGAVVFSIWESWNFFDALYFVFISMSTIGFGDLVPQHPKRMIGTFAYLLFGLALTSMCINVVQEKIHATFLRAKMQIGEKMGFDLDHIMADDYYDGGSAYGDEPPDGHLGNGMDDDNGSYANSVAASQTNSQNGADQQQVIANRSSPGPQQPGDLKASVSMDHHQAPHLADQSQHGKSRSKESLKWKKRSSGGSSDQHSANSIKRKVSSTTTKKLARQTSPQSSSSTGLAQLPANVGPSTGPIKSQLETIRMFNLPVQSQVDDSKPRRSPAAPAPYINQPIAEGIKSFCQPLRRVFQNNPMSRSQSTSKKQAAMQPAQATKDQLRSSPEAPSLNRTSLAASKSFESSPVSSRGSNGRSHAALLNGSYQPTRAAAIRASGTTMLRTNTSPHQRHMHHSGRSRSPKPLSRSLNSSRRASVSHELSQLDDLIVSLSGSPPERFGPLLGVPTQQTSGNRSGRSASPNVILTKGHSIGSSNYLHRPQSQASAYQPSSTSHRRGTSMMVRPTTPTGDGRLNQSNPQRKRALIQSPSHHLLLNEFADSNNNELQAFYDQRRKSSSSYASTTSRVPINNQELNLSESQAALDELEAIKYSAP